MLRKQKLLRLRLLLVEPPRVLLKAEIKTIFGLRVFYSQGKFQNPWFYFNPSLNLNGERKGKQSCGSFEQNSCRKLSGHLPWPIEGSGDRGGKTESIILCLGHRPCFGGPARGALYCQMYQWRAVFRQRSTQIIFQEAEHRVRKQQDRPDSSHSDVSLFLFC